MASILIPFIIRRLKLSRPIAKIFTRYHPMLALASLAILTLHGIIALEGTRGLQWSNLLHINGAMLTGIISWLGLLAVVVLATFTIRLRPFFRAHFWLVGLLVVMVLSHTL